MATKQSQETDKCLFVYIYSKIAKFDQKNTKLNIFLYKKSQFTTTELFTSQQKFDILKGKLIRDRISCDWIMKKFELLNQIFIF